MAEARGGRRREYASDADRVRAWRERRKNQARLQQQQAAAPTDPVEAIVTLADAVPLLRREAHDALDRLAEVARSITTATDLVADPAAIDAHLRRAKADADKVRADAAAEIADLREQLDTAVEDRADADAAAAAAEATAAAAEATAAAATETLDVARRDHTAEQGRWQQQFDTTEREHARQVADLERRIGELTAQVEQHTDRMTAMRSEAEKAAAAAAATLDRFESDLAAARAETRTERERAETARADAAVDRAHTEAARARVDELRAELRELRSTTR